VRALTEPQILELGMALYREDQIVYVDVEPQNVLAQLPEIASDVSMSPREKAKLMGNAEGRDGNTENREKRF
jgi:hypothetical protein